MENKQDNNTNKSVTQEKKAVARAYDLPISTRHSIAICKFIKNKNPDRAIEHLSKVIKKKMAVPITGEIPHRKGIMSGRYPVKASKYFMRIIRDVVANANVKGMNINNLVLHGISNKGSTTYHYGRRGGRFKRTNLTIIAMERIKI